MQVERIKTVGKKKVVAIATTLMLAVGGVSAFASEGGQNYIEDASNKFFASAVTYYVNNVGPELEAYKQEKKNTYTGYLAGLATNYANDIKTHYDNEIKRAKASLDKTAQTAVQDNVNKLEVKNQKTKEAITTEVNAVLANKQTELVDAFEGIIGDSFTSTPAHQ